MCTLNVVILMFLNCFSYVKLDYYSSAQFIFTTNKLELL